MGVAQLRQTFLNRKHVHSINVQVRRRHKAHHHTRSYAKGKLVIFVAIEMIIEQGSYELMTESKLFWATTNEVAILRSSHPVTKMIVENQ